MVNVEDHQVWLGSVVEDVIEPELLIVDPHHHLWPPGGALPYGLDELHADISDGHHIVATVFIECGAAYRADGDELFAPVGETEFVAAEADRDEPTLIRGIVARADLRSERLDEVLDAHEAAGGGRFRGIRHALSRAIEPEALTIPGNAPEGLAADPNFQRGVRRLGERGLTYDSWHYHYQNQEFLELARAAPETTMVLDHFGTPLGVGSFAGRRDEIFESWRTDIAELAGCPNVVAKLGGLAMPDNGFGFDQAERPPSSAVFLAEQRRYYEHTIECFGAERCMFESNFPVDRMSLSYRTFWNACKLLTADLATDERAALFSGTAARIYRLDVALTD
ncbi:MAG: amidohydrolase family protein [Ilumatobacteraceae bacterium]|nr:amidohydrolase family protein [Ilumatobacteraceae bacterium]